MTPYYEQEGVTIYHGDCREVLPSLTADVVVTDAPYGIGDKPFVSDGPRGPRGGGSNTWHPTTTWDGAIDPAWCRLACESAPVVAWFGHWRKRTEVEAAMLFPIRCELIWAKDMHCGPPCPAAMQDERIWIFAKDGVTPTRFETTVWFEGVIPTWSYRHHKNEKPEALMRRLISWLSSGLIIDPFMGSGTTLVAAKRLGHSAIGIEIEERYCEIAAKRLSQRVLPLSVVSAEAQG